MGECPAGRFDSGFVRSARSVGVKVIVVREILYIQSACGGVKRKGEVVDKEDAEIAGIVVTISIPIPEGDVMTVSCVGGEVYLYMFIIPAVIEDNLYGVERV